MRISASQIGSSSKWLLAILTVLFYVQIWPDVGGFTVRSEDIVTVVILGLLVAQLYWDGKFHYHRSRLYLPLLLWAAVFLFGAIVTLTSGYDGDVQRDAIVNSLRLAFSLLIFVAVYNFPAPAITKQRTITATIVIIGLLTTTVALLQIAHWGGVLPFNLPPLLTELQEEASSQRGREIFALYIGNTGSHTWAGMLVVQTLVVWFLAWYSRGRAKRAALLLYFAVLCIILIRISVRNSILGLFVAICFLFLVSSLLSRYSLNRLIKPLALVSIAIVLLGVLFMLGSEYYFTERILQTLPQFEDGRFVIDRGSNIFGRLQTARDALVLFSRSPIVGNGFYSYQYLVNFLGFKDIVHAHNSYLQSLAELGLLGFSILMFLLWRIGSYLVATRRLLFDGRDSALIWQITASIFVFLLFTSLFANTFWSPTYTGIFMLFLGILAARVRERKGT